MYLHLQYTGYKKIYQWKVGSFGILFLGLGKSMALISFISISHTSSFIAQLASLRRQILCQLQFPLIPPGPALSAFEIWRKSEFVWIHACCHFSFHPRFFSILFFLFFFQCLSSEPDRRAEPHQGASDCKTFQRIEIVEITSLHVWPAVTSGNKLDEKISTTFYSSLLSFSVRDTILFHTWTHLSMCYFVRLGNQDFICH